MGSEMCIRDRFGSDVPKEDVPKYMLEPGSVLGWSLFPLPLVARSLGTGRYEAVVLVEGPRDALRLTQLGVPALAIIATTAWSERKCSAVAHLCRSNRVRPVVMMDGDEAGRKAQRRIVSELMKHRFHGGQVAKIRLPDGEDPASVPAEFVRALAKRTRSSAQRTGAL